MKYVVAVSGGIDSMVLLHKLVHEVMADELGNIIVAHFDHGIRPDSSLDEQFVRAAALRYGLTYVSRRELLGAQTGEALARDRRYAFLREVAQRYGGVVVTAHHLDDLVETVAINMLRGTGWRGAAPLDSDIERPLIDETKEELLAYAKKHGVTWREDSTNKSDVYLRNRVRRQLKKMPYDTKRELRALHARQKEVKSDVRQEIRRLVGEGPEYGRYFLTQVSTGVAVECLREITQAALTRPQLLRLLHAVKVAPAGSTYEAGNGVRIHFTTRHFSL